MTTSAPEPPRHASHKPRACRVCPRLRCAASKTPGYVHHVETATSFQTEKNKIEPPRRQTAHICLGEPRSFFKGLMIVVCDHVGGVALGFRPLFRPWVAVASYYASYRVCRPPTLKCPDVLTEHDRVIFHRTESSILASIVARGVVDPPFASELHPTEFLLFDEWCVDRRPFERPEA
ncbi:hypothetical protein THAOC_35604 [Thalassiosira oceanica]|uniref:Uncharacterized protein n=1 Tax=Thalassiosira oceanica TaxID=159749 RepID=K0R1H0_THAOC|nr:hypothetical protein THAOC_35604 [Thalassiosira oceanica]|eukprot:EJK45765.1 hypothetical protein THAOC_35604 [Thalassiosira oceanica]